MKKHLLCGAFICTPLSCQESVIQLVAAAAAEFEILPNKILPLKDEILLGKLQTSKDCALAIKSILEQKTVMDPLIQFNTLRILKALMDQFHPTFTSQVSEIVLPTLKEIGLFLKQSSDDSRGKWYFMHESCQSPFLSKLGDFYLRLILEAIQTWSSWFLGEFENVFKFLKEKNNVIFPSNFIFYRSIMMTQSQLEITNQRKLVHEAIAAAAEMAIIQEEKSAQQASDQNQSSEEKDKDGKQKKVEKVEKKSPYQKVQEVNKEYNNFVDIQKIKNSFQEGCTQDGYQSYKRFFISDYNLTVYRLFPIAKRLLQEGFYPKIQIFNTIIPEIFLQILQSYVISQRTLLEHCQLFHDILLDPLHKISKYQEDFLAKNPSVIIDGSYSFHQDGVSETFSIEPKILLSKFQRCFPNSKQYSIKYELTQYDLSTMDTLKEKIASSMNRINALRERMMDPSLLITEDQAMKGKRFQGDRKLQIFQNKLVTFQYFGNQAQSTGICIDTLTIGKSRKQIRYFSAKDLNDVFQKLEQIEMSLQPLKNIEIRFTLEKVQTEYTQKFQPESIILSRMSFKSCSTELMSSFIMCNTTTEAKVPRAIEIISSYISNSEFSEILNHFNKIRNQALIQAQQNMNQQQQHQFPKIKMKWFLENCKNITFTSFESFNHSIDTCSSVQESNSSDPPSYRNSIEQIWLNLALKTVKTFTHQDFLKLSTFESFRSLRSLKLKSVEGEFMGRVMGDLLSARLVFCSEYNLASQSYQSFLKGLSFDSSVCSKFDDLCLDQEYFGRIKKLRFKNKETEKHEITFGKMKPYSLVNLKELKLKNCILNSSFFSNFSAMTCCVGIETLVLRGSDFDQMELCLMIKTNKLQTLRHVDFSYTQIGDEMCYALYTQYTTSNSLEYLDVSNNQNKRLTHQGVKYLTFINSLKQLVINDCPNAVDDTLSPYIKDMIKRKSKRTKEILENKIESQITQYTNQVEDNIESKRGYITILEKWNEGFNDYHHHLIRMKNIQESQIAVYDYQSFYNSDDTTLCLDILIEMYKDKIDQVNEIKKCLQIIEDRNDQNKIKFEESCVELRKKLNNNGVQSYIKQIDLSGNKNITTAFFIDLTYSGFLQKLYFLKLSSTNVCGEIARILTYNNLFKEDFNRAQSILLQDQDNNLPLKEISLLEQISTKQIEQKQVQRVESQLNLFGTNQNLEVLNLSRCKSILPNKFENLFSSEFKCLMELNLNGCTFFDDQFDILKRNRKRGFPSLVTINLKQTNLTNQALWTFLMESEQLLEIYLDNTNFSVCPPGLRKSSIIKKKEQTIMTKEKKKEIDYGNLTQEILPKVFTFSVSNCKIWEDKQILEILHAVLSPIFDFNSFIGYYKHLISKKLVYYLVKQYKLVKEYFFLNLAGASLVDITESEKSQDNTEQIKKTYFSRAAQVKKEVYTSTLETLVVDNSRINYKLFSKIFKYQPTIRYVSLLNTPYLQPFSVEHRKEKNEDVFSIDQLMALINQKNVLISEQNLKEIMVLISKLKKSDMKRKKSRLHKLKLDGNQQIPHHMIDNLVSALFPFINAVHASYTRISAETIKKISESGHNIEYIGIKGCNHLGKDSLIQICDSKGLSKRFRIECILEMKHLIDYEVISHLARSSYLSNMMILDLSSVQVPNMDDCLMNICFTSQDEAINLRIINLENTQISDRGFQMISVSQKFKNLERIFFKGCPLITERGISFIVDSNNLIRFDLIHFLGQNSQLLNGRIIDTLKYSNRKIFLREINFFSSTISDKEFLKLMNETRSEFYSTKMINLRFTPNITREGIKSIYSIYARSSKKKNDDSDRLYSSLEMLYFDEKRQDVIMDNKVNYIDIFNSLLDPQNTEKALAQIKQEGLQAAPDKPTTTNANQNVSQNQSSSNTSQPKKQQIQISPYPEADQVKLKQWLILNNEYTVKAFEDDFKTDLPFVEIFFYFQKLKNFNYDQFFSCHRHLITDNTLNAFSLMKFICLGKFIQKNQVEDQNAKQTSQILGALASLKKAEDHLISFNKLTFLNLSQNKKLTENSLCRFFVNTQIFSKLAFINLSETNATEAVIDVILSSIFFKDLKFIQFDKCDHLEKSMNSVLVKILEYYKKKPQFLILKTFFFYQRYFDEPTLALYLQHFIQKKIKVKCLDFQMNKEIEGNFLKSPLPNVKLINFSRSMFNITNLNFLSEVANKVKTVWLENSFNFNDYQFNTSLQNNRLPFFNELSTNPNLKYFRTSEFLYSVGKRLEKSISYLMEKILPSFRNPHLNLNYFPQLDPELLVKLMTETTLMSSFKQISLNFSMESQVLAYFKLLDIIFTACQSSELYCFRVNKITIDFKVQMSSIRSKLDVLSAENKIKYLENVKEKIIIDQNITRQFPFVLYKFKVEEQKSSDDFINVFVQSFQLSHINLSTLMTRKVFKMIIKQLRFNNHLVTIILNDLTFIFDKDIIKYFIDKDSKKGFPFQYLKDLQIAGTNVTQYSLLKILEFTPFSSSFKIDECIQQYIENSNHQKDGSINNQLIDNLSKSLYFINIKKLNLSKTPFTDNILSQTFTSPYAVNIEEIILNFTNVSNGTLISIVSTKKMPQLKKFYVNEEANCKQHIHYLLRSKYLSLDLDFSKIIFENNMMFQKDNYVMSLIDSVYMLKQKSLVMKSIQENIENINQLFKLSPYIVNVQQISITSLTDQDNFYPIWVNLAKTDKLPNLQDLVVSKVWVQHLKILLKQENKPKLDLSKLLFENGEVVDDECLQILASQPNLLNMEEMNFSALKISKKQQLNIFKNHFFETSTLKSKLKLTYFISQKVENNIKSATLFEFGLSKYVVNIKRIIFAEDWKGVLRADLPEFDEKIKKKKEKYKKTYEQYEQTGEEMNVNQKDEADSTLLTAGIYEAMLLYNNFSNLEEVEFMSPGLVHPRYLLYIAHRIKKRFYSPKYKIEQLFLHIAHLFQSPDVRDQHYEAYSRLRQVFNIFFYQDRSWFAKRHKSIAFDMFQVLSTNGLYSIRSLINDVSLVEEISFISRSFDQTLNYIFRNSKQYYINLKKINILDIKQQESNFFFTTSVWQEILKQLSIPAVQDFALSPFIYKSILPSHSLYVSYSRTFEIIQLFYPEAIRLMKDIIFDFNEMNDTMIKSFLSKISRSSSCTQLVFKSTSNSTNETNFASMQTSIIKYIIENQCFVGIKRFKPLNKLTIKEFYELAAAQFFDRKQNIFEFYNSQTDQITKVKLSDCITFVNNYKQYLDLEELVIPNFEVDDIKLNQLKEFKIHQMTNLSELKVHRTPTCDDLYYIFNEVLSINPKLKFTFSYIPDDILIGMLGPQKQVIILSSSQDKSPLSPEIKPIALEKPPAIEKDAAGTVITTTTSTLAANGTSEIKVEDKIDAVIESILSKTTHLHKNDDFGKDWKRIIEFINQFSQQLDGAKMVNLFTAVNQNSSRFYISKLGFPQSLILNNVESIPNMIYLTKIHIYENKNTAQIPQLLEKALYSSSIQVSGSNEFNLNHLLPLYGILRCPVVYEQIFNHCSASISQTELALINDEDVFDNMISISFNSNKFILNDRSIENLQSMKKRAANYEDQPGVSKDKQKPNGKKAKAKKEKVAEIEAQKADEAIANIDEENQAEKKDEEGDDNNQGAVDEDKTKDSKKENQLSTKEEAKQEVEEDLQKPEKWITKERLADFLKKFKRIKLIDFSQTNISSEHFTQIDFSRVDFKLQFVNLNNCQIQNPTIFLVQLFQNFDQNKPHTLEPRLQLQRFVSHLSFTNNFQSNSEFIKEIVKSPFFKNYIKYFTFERLLSKHAQNSSELMKILSTIFKKGDNNLCITSFLYHLKELRMNITDTELDQITQSYHQIQYTSPFAFNNVQYGFNHVIQHPSVSPRDKVTYFLNQEFQKKLAGSSFYEILYLVFTESELIQNQIIFQSYSQLLEQELINLQRSISAHQTLLDSFIDRQIGVNSSLYQKITELFAQMEQETKDVSVKDQVKQASDGLNLLFPKYEVIRQNYEIMVKTRKDKTQKQKKGAEDTLKSSKLMLSSQMSSQLLNGENQDIKKKIKNLEARDLSEKRLQSSERQIIKIIQIIIHLDRKMSDKFDHHELSTLLELVENLDLGNNSFLNFKGFNNYVKNHISPWLAMNQGISKLKEPEQITKKFDLSHQNLKRLVQEERREEEAEEENKNKQNDMDNLIEADNELDDKIFDHLCYFIQDKMMGLRIINLSGLNVSDQFAEKFSLILSDSRQLQQLQKMDLTNNKRLTAFGMKYLYSTVVDRIPKGFRLELSSTFSEVQLLEARVVALEKKLQNLEKGRINESLSGPNENKISFFSKLKIKFSQKKPSIPTIKSLLAGKKDELPIISTNKEKTPSENIIAQEKEKKEEKEKQKKDENVTKGIQLLVKQFQKQAVSDSELSYQELQQQFKSFQEYLKTCQEQVEKYDMIGEQVDLTSFLKSGTNIGFYSAINSFVVKNWRTHYLFIIFIALILLPLTLFHLLQLALSRIHTFLSTYTFDADFISNFWGSKKYRIIVDKNVPSSITSEDFYFDEDVAVLDQIIRGKNLQITDSDQKQQLKRVMNFLLNPTQQNRKLIKKGQNDDTLFNILKYFSHIIFINLVVYQIGLTILYPIYIQSNKTTQNCDQSSIIYDIPIYIFLLFSAITEIFLLQNTERIIGSQRIFTTKSLQVISLLWGSFMAKYDIYTDIIFGLQITMCEKLNSFDIGIACLILSVVNTFISFWTQKNCIIAIYKNQMKKSGEIHNTEYINQYTKLALIQELNAFGTVLDRFSTSSAEAPSIKFKFLQGVLFPQVIISKFTRAFVEDIPQIILLLLYNFRQSSNAGTTFSFFNTQYLKVILSSLLSLYSALSHAWHAKPSVFKTYMFQEFSTFILNGKGGYKIDLKFEDYRQSYSFEEIYARIKHYIEVYPIPEENTDQVVKKKVLQNLVANNNLSQSHISAESANNLLDNMSQGGESVNNAPSSHTLKSVAQPNTDTVSEKRRVSVTSINVSESELSETSGRRQKKIPQTFQQELEIYKENLIQYLCTTGFTPEEFHRIKDFQQLQLESKTKSLTAIKLV